MKKPKKTLKDLSRIEALLTKQTERSAKLLARRKAGEAENPVTSGYYARIAAHQATALTDLSEIVHLVETLTRQILEAEADKIARKKKAASALTVKAGPAVKVGAKPARKPTRKAPARKAASVKKASPSARRRAPAKAPSA